MKKPILAFLILGFLIVQNVTYGQCKGNLIFQDEFNGTSLDQSKWNYDLGNGCPSLCGWGNNEKEYYTNSAQNVNVTGGYLNITAIYNQNYAGSGADFTSGKINTKGKFDQLYGRFEASIKMPAGTGLWPAFWMLPTDNSYGGWPTSGEIDIMEYRGDQQSTMYSTMHYGNAWPNNQYDGTTYNLSSGNFTSSFHEFAVEWQPGVLKFYVDNILIKTETQNPATLNPASNNAVAWPWDKRYYIILNMALGGWFSGNPSTQDIINSASYPQSMQVDYVRVYDMAPGGSQSAFTGTAITLPGKIEAENYNIGCEGAAYHDTDASNNGGAYRTDAVDIEACTDAGGGYDVGWTAAGEWLNYNVNVAATAVYTINARMASLPGNKNFHLELDGVNISGTMTVPSTGAWNTYQTITVNNVTITSGSKVLKIVFDDGDVNCNWIQFNQMSNTPPQVSISSPGNGATYTAPANITLTANATDNISVSKVEFFQGSTKLGEDLTSPYSFDWTTVAAGTYSITAKATDNAGAATTSTAVSIIVNAAQITTLPLDFINHSTYADNQIYVAIVGEDLTGPPGAFVWVDMKTGNQMPMNPSYNTVAGPVYSGNKGPGGNAMYANCFTKLSEIPNKTVSFQKIQGCRIFVSFGQQLYLYFFGSTGAVKGYASPNHTDPSDPNTGIKYEIIELTYNQYGFWGNTTRVDGYSYPMGLELTGGNGFQKTGELKLDQDIGALYLASVPNEFKKCYNAATGTITFPTKTLDFADGSIGTMPTPGPYVDYMKPYIDAIWAKYVNEDLIFDAGDAGIWKGRVINERLEMTAQTGGYAGRKGIVAHRPSTQEAFEGKGILNNVVQDATTDLIIQAQLCAAISRHIVNTTTPNVGQQNWSNPATFYQTAPCNYYAKFWHDLGISYNQKSYAFAYDDVFDQSSTLQSSTPSKVTVVIGGYGVANQPPVISITAPINNVSYMAPASITITANATDSDGSISKVEYYNGSTLLGTVTTGSTYSYNWTNVAAGTYTITAKAYDNLNAVTTSSAITVKVNTNQAPTVSITAPVNNASYMAPASITITANATDSDGSISKVEYYNGSTLLGTVTTGSTYSYNWTNVAAGTYTITAKAYDNLNAVTTSSAITVKANTNQAPTVSITAPVNNSSYMAPANVTITANATDSDGSISKVEYYNGSTLLGTVTAGSTYSYNWTNVLAGTYTITAKAYDNLNAVTTSSAITVKVNANQAPVVSITAPVNNASYMAPASITITANATDSDASISKVEYYNGSTLLGTVTTGSTYSYSWTNVAAGTYTITAKAYDNLNAVTTSSAITVKVNANQAPAISITAPANNASYMAPGSISITVNATDSDGSISKVEYYNGSTLLGTVTVGSTYSYNWTNVAAGTYTITAKAYDNLNAVTTSSAITVKVNTNQAPTINITSPVNNADVNVGESIAITAEASDTDGSVVKVEFFNGNTKIGETSTSPYTMNWLASNAGTYTIRVVATDNTGATSEDAITVQVNVATGTHAAQTIDLNFYPNPIKDILYFSTSVEQITVYSINGMVVKDISLNGMNYLTTSDLRSGMYVCEVVTQQGKAFIKILKE